MFYIKGGAAAVREQTGVVDNGLPVTINTTTTKTQTGFAAGGGVEYGIDMHWSVKAEYLFLGVQRNINPARRSAVSPLEPSIAPPRTRLGSKRSRLA